MPCVLRCRDLFVGKDNEMMVSLPTKLARPVQALLPDTGRHGASGSWAECCAEKPHLQTFVRRKAIWHVWREKLFQPGGAACKAGWGDKESSQIGREGKLACKRGLQKNWGREDRASCSCSPLLCDQPTGLCDWTNFPGTAEERLHRASGPHTARTRDLDCFAQSSSSASAHTSVCYWWRFLFSIKS